MQLSSLPVPALKTLLVAVLAIAVVSCSSTQNVYDEDGEFRNATNRFVHDFEAMLRSMLSTRDGNALGVTILGSDMGKLYVALAQGIERFRQ